MGKYCLVLHLVLFVIGWGAVPLCGAAAAPEPTLSPDNPLSALFGPAPPPKPRANLEERMTTVAVLIGLLALGVVVPTLLWCQKLSESVTRLRASLPSADAGQRLAELAQESQSLQARVDHLRQYWQADADKLEAIVRRLESNVAELAQAYGNLDTVSKDLDNLRAFRSYVERVHAGIQKAFNGTLAGPLPAAVPDQTSPPANA
jgi:hypothetical protein